MKNLLLALFCAASLSAASPEVTQYIETLQSKAALADPAFEGFDAKRGEAVFTSEHLGKKGKTIACTSCHTVNLASKGENYFTGKVIEPLAPSANSLRLTSAKEVEKWLRRNFNDVYNREGTAKEKGDVLIYIMTK
ncbi:MAG: DUF1924 domain-containing protein [Helicobacteraceae bacterium]|jgi:cytochrome c peroxidase|nr:DUF1924 domain-containing protein [Helicobacteraceae bacterium]